ncbi:hypothetical protein NKCBBBOE_03595 [Pseudarthrobacter sp. MM222]|nr:hypothetical protein NKCBBBOE_03595 [Pseudarthrobacter sp. MM222]
MGPEIGAALTAVDPLGVDAIGLNCATGPDEISEHLRHLSKQSSVAIVCMPTAGLPVLRASDAHYPLSPTGIATAHEEFVGECGLGVVGGCSGTSRSTWTPSSSALRTIGAVTNGGRGADGGRVPAER